MPRAVPAAPHAILRTTAIAAAILAALPLALLSRAPRREVWTRDHPLTDPIPVTQVRTGVLTLADGRTLRPAGIRRAEGVTPDEFDLALRALTAQGVLVGRKLDGGRAMLTAEPKFYNWCGTRGMPGDPRARWAGCYLPCPVSEFMIHTGYALPEPDQPGLTAAERRRLAGAADLAPARDRPVTVRAESMAFRFEGGESLLADLDTWLEITGPPRSPEE